MKTKRIATFYAILAAALYAINIPVSIPMSTAIPTSMVRMKQSTATPIKPSKTTSTPMRYEGSMKKVKITAIRIASYQDLMARYENPIENAMTASGRSAFTSKR